MNRRRFLTAAAASALESADSKGKLLLPSDEPDEFGFRLMWYNPVPALDASNYRLKVQGLVEKPQLFSLADLRRLPQDSQNSRLKCVQCWSARTTWGGFRFGHLLETAKPLKTAKAVRVDCADKWYEYFSIQELLSPRVLLVLDMAGKPLAERHGAPLRLIDPGRYGSYFQNPALLRKSLGLLRPLGLPELQPFVELLERSTVAGLGAYVTF